MYKDGDEAKHTPHKGIHRKHIYSFLDAYRPVVQETRDAEQ